MASVAELLNLPIIALQNAFLCADCDAVSTRGDVCPHCASQHAMLSLSNLLNNRSGASEGLERITAAVDGLEAAIFAPEPFILTPPKTNRFTEPDETRYRSSMRKYTKAKVLKFLKDKVDETSQTAVAASLGVSSVFVSYVLTGKRTLSSDLAFRLGFIKLEDLYIREEDYNEARNEPVKVVATGKKAKGKK